MNRPCGNCGHRERGHAMSGACMDCECDCFVAPTEVREAIELEHPTGGTVTIHLPASAGLVGDTLMALGGLGYEAA
jgi:hypothetical protein